MSLEGKTALVTGSSRGIGQGHCARPGGAGCERGRALLSERVGRQGHAGTGTLPRLGRLHGAGRRPEAPTKCAACSARSRTSSARWTSSSSNARPEAPAFFYPTLEITLEQWDAGVDSQAKAFLVAAQEAAKLMPDGGRMLAITYAPGSITGGLQPWVAMGAAKSALESLVRYFAVALAPRGITVNAISPGWTEDSVLNSFPEAVQDLIRNWHKGGWTPMRRLGTPADIGKVVALLCSEDAAWITGQVINADGGASLMLSGGAAGDSDRVG